MSVDAPFDTIPNHSTQFGTILHYSVPLGTIQHCKVPFCRFQNHLATFGTLQYQFAPIHTIQYNSAAFSTIRHHSTPFGNIWYHSVQEIIILPDSILQAGTFQIINLAEDPRWKRVRQYTCPLPQTKTKTSIMGGDRGRLTQNNRGGQT